MDNTVFMIFIMTIFLIFGLILFALFAIGFVIGYKIEDRRLIKKKRFAQDKPIQESAEEKKSKKEWKKFLEYDGSTPTGYK